MLERNHPNRSKRSARRHRGGSSRDSRSRTQGQASVIDVCGFSKGKTADKNGVPLYPLMNKMPKLRILLSSVTVATEGIKTELTPFEDRRFHPAGGSNRGYGFSLFENGRDGFHNRRNHKPLPHCRESPGTNDPIDRLVGGVSFQLN